MSSAPLGVPRLRRLLRQSWPMAACVVALLALGVLFFGLFDLPRQQRDASNHVQHTLEVLAATSAVQAHLAQAVTDGRSYILSGDAAIRARAEAEFGPIDDDLATLRALFAADPGQLAAIDRLRDLVAARTAMLRQNMDLYATGNLATLQQRIQTHAAHIISEQTVASLDSIRATERRLLQQRQAAADAATRRTVAALIACGALAAVSLFLAVTLVIRHRRERARVSDLRRTDAQQIAASEARQRAYFNHSPIGMVVMRVAENGDFVLEDINPAARIAFGFAPDSAPGLTHAELWPEMVARDKQHKMQACASRREVIEYTVARDIRGKTRLLDIVLAPLPDDAATARFVLICVHDVTRQRELERQVVEHAERQAESAEREMALFRNSPDELFVVRVEHETDGPTFTYEAFSPAVEAATGLPTREMVGRQPHDCVPPSVALQVLENYRRCLQEQTTIKFSATRALPVGVRDVEGWVTPVRHPATGRINRLVGMVRDVTDRNRMEATLRHGQKMEAIGRLAAGVAHDFNNILQAIISGLDLVIEEVPAGTPAHDVAVVALGAAMRGSHLTHHLLSYARKQMLWPQAIDLGSFLPEMKLLLARTLGPHITIELRHQGAPLTIVDPGELQTALLNLAINAAQAMPKGGLLHIAAQQDGAADQSWAEITVTDTGTGMDEAILAQAMEPFFSTKGVGGTGLGLSMVQGFVEQSGGTLRIASTPGRGTRVTLRLPATSTAGLSAPPEPTGPMHGTGRILLVDDSTDVLVTVGAFLVKAGFDVVRAESGDRALDVLADDPHFDALVADYAMPGLNGADLIAQARLLKPGLPALVITGYASIGETEGAAQATAVLHKPFQRQDLIAALRRITACGDVRGVDAEANAARLAFSLSTPGVGEGRGKAGGRAAHV